METQSTQNTAANAYDPRYNGYSGPAAGYYCHAYAPPLKIPYVYKRGDGVLAVSMLALGFLFWEWGILLSGSTLGRFLFFMLALCVCLIYMHSRAIRQSAKSFAALAALILGILPFLLYDDLPVNGFLLFFDSAAFLVWIAFSSGTEISAKFSGFIFFDWVNQSFVVPFVNFTGLFGGLRGNPQDGKQSAEGAEGAHGGASAEDAQGGGASGQTRKRRGALFGVVGAVVSLPILIGIIFLLIAADQSFEDFAVNLADDIDFAHIGTYIWEFAFGIPVACYLFGAIHGNANKRRTAHITEEASAKALAGARRIPTSAVCAPLLLMNAIYVVFFIVMGSYLFSAFAGDLPTAYTYAEYARRGFFELCGIAAINLAVLAFSAAFAKRGAGPAGCPKTLRVLSGTLSVLSALLVTTAMSKMLLYIGAYGLSRLRIYTLWFMILLLLVFAALIVRHIRPFRVGRPIAVIGVVMVLILYLSGTDGMIAKYNVQAYEDGRLAAVDTEMLARMSDAAIPYLYELKAHASDETTRDKAAAAIYQHGRAKTLLEGDESFAHWDLQTAKAQTFGESQ